MLRYLAEALPGNSYYGFDISWSRIKEGQKHLETTKITDHNLFVGDLFNIPLADNSVDVVYTRQAMEPNGGHEAEILQELYRITKRLLILAEPSYEFADAEGRKRMDYHGYIKNLKGTAEKLGYKIEKYEKMPEDCSYSYNPLALMVIEKECDDPSHNVFRCPITHAVLTRYKDAFFSKDSMLAYPILSGVPMLVESSAVVATKYMDY